MRKIDISKWKEFAVCELFSDLQRGSMPIFRNLDKGNTPVIAASMFNQGITGYYNVEAVFQNRITVSLNGVGSGYFAYHNYSFAANSDCGILIERVSLNMWTAMFLCAVLNKIGANYGYEEKVTKSKLLAEKIKLPSTSEGTPDWQYMENYIRQIEKLQRRNLQLINGLLPPLRQTVTH